LNIRHTPLLSRFYTVHCRCIVRRGKTDVAPRHSRADTYRRRAIELAEEARWENDKARRRFLLDKARGAVAAADEIAPELPAEPQIFRKP
jgi:hypothetical protein